MPESWSGYPTLVHEAPSHVSRPSSAKAAPELPLPPAGDAERARPGTGSAWGDRGAAHHARRRSTADARWPSTAPSAPPMPHAEGLDGATITRPQSTSSLAYSDRGESPSTSARHYPRMSDEDRQPSTQAMPAKLDLAWPTMVAYDAALRLCLYAKAKDPQPQEPDQLLHNGGELLRSAFGLQEYLLQPGGGNAVQGNVAPSAPLMFSGSIVETGQKEETDKCKLRVQIRKAKGFVRGKDRLRQLLGDSEAGQAGLVCLLRLKGSHAEKPLRTQPGSGETVILELTDSEKGEELHIHVQDSKSRACGSIRISLETLDAPKASRLCQCSSKLFNGALWTLSAKPDAHFVHAQDRQWFDVLDEKHQPAGKLQISLFLQRVPVVTSEGSGSSSDEVENAVITEATAFNVVLAAAFHASGLRQRQLELQSPWSWLVYEFISCYDVSDAHFRLRSLWHVLRVATPTMDCLDTVLAHLTPLLQYQKRNNLSSQERRTLAVLREQVERLVAHAFHHYKSLNEEETSGLLADGRVLANRTSPALFPAVKLFSLLHESLGDEAQIKLEGLLRSAVQKRWRRLSAECDEQQEEKDLKTAPLVLAYNRHSKLCAQLAVETEHDLQIHAMHILPSTLDLPQLAADIYMKEIGAKLRAFMTRNPPSAPAAHVTELLNAVGDLNTKLLAWGIRVSADIEVESLFGKYIEKWVHEAQDRLLAFVAAKAAEPHPNEVMAPTAFAEAVYGKINETLVNLEPVMARWPANAPVLESAICEVERHVICGLERMCGAHIPKRKDPHKSPTMLATAKHLAKKTREPVIYLVPPPLAGMMNALKRLLDGLRPSVETRLRAWARAAERAGLAQSDRACGEHLLAVTVELKTKYKTAVTTVVDRLSENPLIRLLEEALASLAELLSARLFATIARGVWDYFGREVLHYLEDVKENVSFVKRQTAAAAMECLDKRITEAIQRRLGDKGLERDFTPPRSVEEAKRLMALDSACNSPHASFSLY
eukprot:jgi/Chlat1/6440/Chrsp45S06048